MAHSVSNSSTTTASSLLKASETFTIQSESDVVLYVLLLQVFSSYLCYIFAKFACKIKIQEFSFALPLSLATPLAVVATVALAWVRESDLCSVNNYLPKYLALQVGSPSDYRNITDFVMNKIVGEYLWLWLLWWLSQLWVTHHVWRPKNDKNLPTEKLFICPWYCGFLVEQCITLNRRIVDWNEEYLSIKVSSFRMQVHVNFYHSPCP